MNLHQNLHKHIFKEVRLKSQLRPHYLYITSNLYYKKRLCQMHPHYNEAPAQSEFSQ